MHAKQGLSFILSVPNDPSSEIFFLKMASCQLETVQNIFCLLPQLFPQFLGL